ncbi:MAG TPA: gluconokinase [Luteolibacter sp.]
MKPRIIILMGVAGCGKSTIGALLATKNGGVFHDADTFHPPANLAKMAAGIPLDDADRAPWLARLRQEVIDQAPAGRLTVLACSALKKRYREQLGVGTSGVSLVYLKGTHTLLASRLAGRANHFMKAGMLDSQLATLEEPSPEEGVTIGIDASAEEIVSAIETALGLHSSR